MAKPRKVQEPVAPYAAEPKKPAMRPETPADTGQTTDKSVRTVDESQMRQLADKVFAERNDLLRRLAQ